MDIPTYIIIFAFAISIIIILLLKLLNISQIKSLKIKFLSFSVIWILVTSFGELIYHWAGNTAVCSKYLGCTPGFFGYDAFEHLFFGIALIFFIIWFCKRFPKYSILYSSWWKDVLVLIAIVALVSIMWEFMECAHDFFRVSFLHEQLVSYRLHFQFNYLDQPSNIDTMGDLAFSIFGSVVALLFTNLKN